MSTKITYNGNTTEVADGYIATLPCKDYKMETDVVVEAPEGSGVAIAEWNGSIAYNPDAIVIFEEIYYVCIKATTAGSVVNNPSVTPSEWQKLNGAYKGEYDSSETYYKGDIVVSGGNLYQAKIDSPETSPDNDMASRWELLHEGGGGGAELNIAYGDTAPEDTSKLWVKTTQPSVVRVTTKLGSIEERIDTGVGTLPYTVSNANSVTIGAKVYLLGGYSDINGRRLDTISVYDTESNTTTILSATLPRRTNGMASAVVGTKVYLLGGIALITGENSSESIDTINVFDTESETITTLSTKLPTAANGMASAVVGTKVYVFGGYATGGRLDTINVFDTESETITTLSTKLPTENSKMVSAVVGTKVYLFGGASDSSRLDTINVFDTESETITTLSTKLPTENSKMVSAVVGTKVYLFGGASDSSNLNTINVFDTKDNTITTLSEKLPTMVCDVSSATIGTKVYLLGGASGSIYLDTINVFSCARSLASGNMIIEPSVSQNIFNLLPNVEIGVKNVYLGNADNEGEVVEAALHNGTSWVTI